MSSRMTPALLEAAKDRLLLLLDILDLPPVPEQRASAVAEAKALVNGLYTEGLGERPHQPSLLRKSVLGRRTYAEWRCHRCTATTVTTGASPGEQWVGCPGEIAAKAENSTSQEHETP